jgi:hypothetical protein
LSLSIVGVVVDTLDVALLTHEVGKGLGKGGAVWHSSVRANTAVGEGGLMGS